MSLPSWTFCSVKNCRLVVFVVVAEAAIVLIGHGVDLFDARDGTSSGPELCANFTSRILLRDCCHSLALVSRLTFLGSFLVDDFEVEFVCEGLKLFLVHGVKWLGCGFVFHV